MRQVAHFIGEDVLKTGMKDYFEKYAFKNAELSDFMECFQKAASQTNLDIDLMEWMKTWLQTSGINTLKPIIEQKENKWIINIK